MVTVRELRQSQEPLLDQELHADDESANYIALRVGTTSCWDYILAPARSNYMQCLCKRLNSSPANASENRNATELNRIH